MPGAFPHSGDVLLGFAEARCRDTGAGIQGVGDEIGRRGMRREDVAKEQARRGESKAF